MVIKINYTSSDIYVSTNVSPVYVVVNYSAVNNGGGNFVPYTGATGDVDLGEYELKAGQVEFDQTPTGTAGVGVMRWNDSDGTVDLGLKGGNVTLQVGQEQVQRVVNKSGASLSESAYQVVKVTTAQGQRLAVDLAQGNNDANSTDTLGIVTETIANNQEGFITTSGLVRNINTTGSLQGETWADGDVLYLSATTAGAITKVKPTAPNHTVILGYVVYAHANNGKIFVKVDNGYEIGELHDVYVPNPSNNDGIFWNTANSRYQNNTIAGALGYTPVPTTRTLTINGTAYDLSADRSWTVSGSATPAGSNTQIQYNNSGVFGASAGLVYDDSTGRITLSKNQNAGTFINVSNTTNNTSAQAAIVLSNNLGLGFGQLTLASTLYTPYKTINSGDLTLYKTGSGDITLFHDSGTGKIKFSAGSSSTAQMTITSAGRLLLGTTSESTYLLDVNGTARVSGEMLISGLTIGKGNYNDSRNTALGFEALLNQQNNGVLNTAVGYRAGKNLSSTVTGFNSQNTFIGANSGLNHNTGENNTAVGTGSFSSSVSGAGNTAIGRNSLAANLADSNTAVGNSSGSGITTGYNNVAIGVSTLTLCASGNQNTAVGSFSLQNTTANNNSAFGERTLNTATSGTYNSGFGQQSLFRLTTGGYNTAIGAISGFDITTGSNNIFVGWEAGRFVGSGTTQNQTSSDSIYIGYSARASANGNTNELVIGYNAIGAGSNTATIGNTSITKTILRGTLNAANLPTSSAGLSAGDIWNDGGTLKIV